MRRDYQQQWFSTFCLFHFGAEYIGAPDNRRLTRPRAGDLTRALPACENKRHERRGAICSVFCVVDYNNHSKGSTRKRDSKTDPCDGRDLGIREIKLNSKQRGARGFVQEPVADRALVHMARKTNVSYWVSHIFQRLPAAHNMVSFLRISFVEIFPCFAENDQAS